MPTNEHTCISDRGCQNEDLTHAVKAQMAAGLKWPTVDFWAFGPKVHPDNQLENITINCYYKCKS